MQEDLPSCSREGAATAPALSQVCWEPTRWIGKVPLGLPSLSSAGHLPAGLLLMKPCRGGTQGASTASLKTAKNTCSKMCPSSSGI